MCRDRLSLGFNFSLWWIKSRPHPASSSGLPPLHGHTSWVRTQEISQSSEEKLRLAGRWVSGLAPQPHHLASAQPALHVLNPSGRFLLRKPFCPTASMSHQPLPPPRENAYHARSSAPLPESGSPMPQKEHELFHQMVQS